MGSLIVQEERGFLNVLNPACVGWPLPERLWLRNKLLLYTSFACLLGDLWRLPSTVAVDAVDVFELTRSRTPSSPHSSSDPFRPMLPLLYSWLFISIFACLFGSLSTSIAVLLSWPPSRYSEILRGFSTPSEVRLDNFFADEILKISNTSIV